MVSNNSLVTEVSGTVSIADANTIHNDSATGVVTTTIETQSASQLATLAGSGNAYTIIVSASEATASDLLAVIGKTTLEVNAESVTKITGTVAELETLRTAISNDEINIGASVPIDVTGTILSAEDLNHINDMTNGTVTVTEMTEIEGTVSDINTLYQNKTGFNGITGKDVTVTDAGSFSDTDFNQISNGDIATLNFAVGDDSISFANQTSFDSWADKFEEVDFGSSNSDSVSFNNAVNGELDFSNISELENVNLSGDADSVTLTPNSDTIAVDGGAGEDNFTLDFSSIGRFEIDGGSGDDTVTLSDSSTAINISNTFSNFTNFEALDFSGASNNITLDATALQNIATEPITGFEVNGLSDETSWTIDGFSRYKYSSDGNTYGEWQEVTSIDRSTNGDTGFYQLDTSGDSNHDITLQLTAV
jgi:hypothetical protein